MERILKFSVLRYSPSSISGETINLGILFSDETCGFCSFKYAQKLERVLKFDDTLKREELLNLLGGIEEEVSSCNGQIFDIDSFVKFYINGYSFSKPQKIVYEDINAAIEELYGTFLRFDLPKEKRPTKSNDYDVLLKIIQASGKSIKRNKLVRGQFEDKIRYDFVLDDCCVKIFDFDEKNLNRMINTAKIWAWNCNHEKKNVYIIFRYSNKNLDESSFRIIKSIFGETKCVFKKIEEASDLFPEVG